MKKTGVVVGLVAGALTLLTGESTYAAVANAIIWGVVVESILWTLDHTRTRRRIRDEARARLASKSSRA